MYKLAKDLKVGLLNCTSLSVQHELHFILGTLLTRIAKHTVAFSRKSSISIEVSVTLTLGLAHCRNAGSKSKQSLKL